MRAGGELVPMTPDLLKRIFGEATPDFSAQVCVQAGLVDLDPFAIDAFRTRWSQKAGNPRLLTLSDEQTLLDSELLVEGGLTYAALILFGQQKALGRYLAQAEVVFEYRSSGASGPAQDRIDYRMGFFLFHDALWQRVDLRNERQSYQDGLFRFEIPTFDEAVIREAVLNAVCHRERARSVHEQGAAGAAPGTLLSGRLRSGRIAASAAACRPAYDSDLLAGTWPGGPNQAGG
jgi:ATP-dependent DNA helicase RecG